MSPWGTDRITLIGTRELAELRKLNAELLHMLIRAEPWIGGEIGFGSRGLADDVASLIAKARGEARK